MITSLIVGVTVGVALILVVTVGVILMVGVVVDVGVMLGVILEVGVGHGKNTPETVGLMQSISPCELYADTL